MIYLQLFGTFFKIGLFNFGGGYPMISLIQSEVVVKHSWLTTAQFTDLVAVSQMTPGPLGINLATYTGYLASGSVWGAALATTAVCLPSFLLMLIFSRYVLQNKQNKRVQDVFVGLRPAVIGLIAAAALVLCNKENFADYTSLFIFAGAFVLLFRFKVGPIPLILLAGAVGFVLY